MNLFTISELYQYSGIKPYTIRKWEERYNALTPARSSGNTRYYDGLQLKKLLNIVQLRNAGFKISTICEIDHNEISINLNALYQEKTLIDSKEEFVIRGLLEAGITYDEEKFNYIFSISVKLIGFEETYTNVIFPLLSRIGLLWSKDDFTPANEHFISHLVIRKIYSAIDQLPIIKSPSQRWLLFLPEGEDHEIGLLISYYLIKKAGYSCIYLGPNLPEIDIVQTVVKSQATKLLTFISHNDAQENRNIFISNLLEIKNIETICIAGNVENNVSIIFHNKIKYIDSFVELKSTLN
jgi:DNA-binding transcriptional MerR regulator